MKSHSLRKLSIPLIILAGFLYLAFNSGTKAQDKEDSKGKAKSPHAISIMKFNPFSEADSTERNGSSIEPDAATVGTNVNVSNQAGPQSETDIAIDPTNPNHLIGGSNDISSGNMRVYESTNGGASWTNSALPLPASPFNGFASDPAVTFDRSGNAYYSFLGVNSTGTATSLVCTKKAAGATTWGPNVTVPNTNADKNLMTADRTGGTFNNNVYIAWDNNNSTSQTLMVARSTNGGASFTAVRVNDTGTTVIGADPAIGPNGEVYVCWSNYASTQHNIFIDRSTDGGVTFGTDHIIHHWVAATGSGLGVNPPSDPQRGVPLFGFIDVDRSTGPNRGTVYAVLNDTNGSNGLDILLRKSTDGGATWSAAKRVNDDATGVVRDQIFPRLAVDDSDGSIHISWQDTRDDSTNKKTHVYYTRSTDGGNTFEPNTRVTTAQSDESLTGRDANGYGDYSGIAVMNGTARPLWTDSRSGSEEVFTAAITNGAVTPDFGITATPTSQTVTQGNSTSYTVNTSTTGGFSGSISLSVSGLPTGATASFSPNPVGAGSSATLTVNTGSAAAGSSTLSITGTSGALSHSTSVGLTINPAATPNFSLSVSPTALSINQGTNGSVAVSSTVSGGFNSSVSLSASGLPTGVTASFSPATLAAPGSGSSTMTLSALSTATIGTVTVTITGTGGGLTRTTTLSLSINGAVTNSQLIVNGGFEAGISPWVLSGSASRASVSGGTGSFPHAGDAYIFLCNNNNGSGQAFQTITIPANATAANLTFFLNITSQETTTTTQFDRFFVEVRNTSGTLLSTLATFSNLNKAANGAYTQRGAFSLLPFKGQTIRVQFRATTDFSLSTIFRVDDVSVAATTAVRNHHRGHER